MQGREGEELPFFKVGDLGASDDGETMGAGNHTISRHTADELRAKVIPTGSIIYAKIGAALLLNRRRITNVECCIDNNLTAFTPKTNQVTSRWAFYWLGTIDFGKVVNPGAVPSLSEGDQCVLPILVPPIADQAAIAAFLDRETGKIDALVAEQERLMALLKEKRSAVISQAVTKGLNPDAKMKPSGVEWFGEVPKHWDVRALAGLVRSGTSITYGIVQAGPDVEDGVPYIRTSDMSGATLPESGYLRTSADIAKAYDRSRVEVGDLVIAIRATIGKTLPVPEWLDGANLTQGTAKIAPGPSVHPGFLLLFLNSSVAGQGFDAMSKGATFKEITLDMLRKFRAPLPPLDEQEMIAEQLAIKSSLLDQLASDAESAIALLKERRAALISAAVTGKIDVRGLTPAEVAV